MSIREELEREADQLLRGIKAKGGEGNGYNLAGRMALKRRVEAKARQKPKRKARKDA